MTLDDLERLFRQRYPEGSFRKQPLRNMSACKVRFRPGERVYTYKGTPQEMAAEMKLTYQVKDLVGDTILPSPDDSGRYTCQVNFMLNRWRVETISVTSPFTGLTLTLPSGLAHALPANLWQRIKDHVKLTRQKRRIIRDLAVDMSLTVDELKAIKEVYDRQQKMLLGSK